MKWKNMFVALTLLCLVVLLAGCGGGEEYLENHDSIDVMCEDDFEFTLTLLPEGAAADQLTWTIGKGKDVITDAGRNGTSAVFHADRPGYATVEARGNIGKDYYCETFKVYVIPQGGIRFTQDEYYIMGGSETVLELTYDDWDDAHGYAFKDRISITAEPDIEGKIEFMASNDKGLARRIRAINTKADSPEEFIFKALCGISEDEACVIKCHRNDPAQVALYYAKGRPGPRTEGNVITLECFDGDYDNSFDQEYVSQMGKDPKGKYAVCSQEYQNGSVHFKCGLMSQLPDYLRPDSMAEVEYLLQYRPGEPVHITDYFEEGTGKRIPAYQSTVDIVLVNAVTGEVKENICTLYGGKEFSSKMDVWKGSESVFGSDVTDREINEVLFSEIAKLWESEGYEVKRSE